MSRLFVSSLVACILCLSFMSCADEAAEFSELQEAALETRSETERQACFTINYPVSILFPDGTTVEVSSKRETVKAKRAYRKSGGQSGKAAFVYPITITLKDDTVQVVAGKEEITALKESCREERKKERCSTINYPVTLNVPGQENLVVQNRKELNQARKNNRRANRTSEDRVTIAYPYSVTLQDGSVLEINSAEDLAALRVQCPKKEGDRRERRKERIHDRG